MKERPILFSGSMVRAILEGRKTQTRRLVKPQPSYNGSLCDGAVVCRTDFLPPDALMIPDGGVVGLDVPCPYGEPGDRLWVRETWTVGDMGPVREGAPIEYAADHAGNPHAGPWRPSIHMPRWASRITLRVTSVRVERLQAITEDDARAEGVVAQPLDPRDDVAHIVAFQNLWARINGWESWAANMWVWVVGFEVVR